MPFFEKAIKRKYELSDSSHKLRTAYAFTEANGFRSSDMITAYSS
jgi:hypothetical protein